MENLNNKIAGLDKQTIEALLAQYVSSLSQKGNNNEPANEAHNDDELRARLRSCLSARGDATLFEISEAVSRYKLIRVADETKDLYVYNGNNGLWEKCDIEVWVNDCLLHAIIDVAMSIDGLGRAYVKDVQKGSSLLELQRLIKSKGSLRVSLRQFDSIVDKVCVKNGVLDLRTLSLLDFDAKYMFTKGSNVNYVPNAKDASFDKALSILGADEQRWLQTYAGTGLIKRQLSPTITCLVGKGANGKSTLLSALRRPMPESKLISADFFTEGVKREDMNPLGSPFVACEEMPESKLSSTRIKLSTGNERVTSRQLYSDEQEIEVRATIVVATNYMPTPSALGPGIERRFNIIPIQKTFYNSNVIGEAYSQGDDKIGVKLASISAQEAILSWLAIGANNALTNGLDAPTALMTQAHANWVKEAKDAITPLESFIEENLEDANENTYVFLGVLQKAYNEHCKSVGVKGDVKPGEFEKTLQEAGYKVTTRKPRVNDILSGDPKSKGAKKIYGLAFQERAETREESSIRRYNTLRDDSISRAKSHGDTGSMILSNRGTVAGMYEDSLSYDDGIDW